MNFSFSVLIELDQSQKKTPMSLMTEWKLTALIQK